MSAPLHQPRNRVPRFAEAAVERARLTVVPRRVAATAPRVPFVTLVSTLLVGGVVGLLLFNTHMQQGSFVASSLEEQAAVLTGKEESLRMELHRLGDPQHVAARAKKLGMVPSSSPAFLRLSDGKVLGNPGPARAGDAFRIAPLPPVKPRPELVIADVPRQRADPSPGPRRANDRRDAANRRRDADRDTATGSRDRRTEERTKKQDRRGGERRSGGRTR
jgi:hypothetical protein